MRLIAAALSTTVLVVLLATGVSIARERESPVVPDIFASPINGGCYLATRYDCRIHVDPFTINVASGQRLVAFQLLANGNLIYDFRTDVSNPPVGNYTPSLVKRDFGAACNSTYVVNLLGRDSGDTNFLNLGQTTLIICPQSEPRLLYLPVIFKAAPAW